MIFRELAHHQTAPTPTILLGPAYCGSGPYRLVFGPTPDAPKGYIRADAASGAAQRLGGSVVNTPLPRDTADEVYLCHALDVLPRALVTRAIRECQRMLKPGARLVVRGLDVGRCLEAARNGRLRAAELSQAMAFGGAAGARAQSWFTEGRAVQHLIDHRFEAVRPVQPGGPADPHRGTEGSSAVYDWIVEARKPLVRRKSVTLSGWGHLSSMYFVNREVMRGFVRRGYEVSFHLGFHGQGLLPMLPGDPFVEELSRRPPTGDVWVNYVGQYPPEPRDVVTSLMPCDSTLMNARLVEEMNRKCHFVLTPSALSCEILHRSGVEVPVRIAPLGVDTEVFRADGPRYDFGLEQGTFVFFIHSHFQPRKGLDILLPAFVEEFSEGEPVALVVKESGAVAETADRLRSMIAHARAQVDSPPEVKLIAETSSLPEIAAMLRSADCFVWASRIEGFGLPPLEALACGTPVIAPDYGGHMDYLDDDVALIYPIRGFERMSEEYRTFHLFDPAGQWACPDPHGLRRALRQAFEDGEHLARLGGNGPARAAEYAWPVVADKTVDIVEAALP